MIDKLKTESVTEFLARGGKILKLPTHRADPKVDVIKKTPTSGYATIMSLGEAELFYGEKDPRKKIKKTVQSSSKLDVSALPDILKNKYLNRLRDEENNVEDL